MRTIAERLTYARRNAQQLNPSLFTEDNKLKSDVRNSILKITHEFLEYLQVDIKVMDIRLVGSNASYNYTSNSDLDIHIITDLSEVSDPEMIARLYFDAIKKQFKDSYDIFIKGIEVELYVEDINTTSISNGIYSVLEDKWVKEPSTSDTIIPSPEALDQAEEIEEEILDSIESSKTVEELQSIVDKIYLMRKDSLATDGEVGAGNLAFKSLRNKGVLDKVKETIRGATSRELSLEGLETKFF